MSLADLFSILEAGRSSVESFRLNRFMRVTLERQRPTQGLEFPVIFLSRFPAYKALAEEPIAFVLP